MYTKIICLLAAALILASCTLTAANNVEEPPPPTATILPPTPDKPIDNNSDLSNQPYCMEVADGNGYPEITPSTLHSERCLELHPGVVTVTWPDAPADFAELEFWTMDPTGNTDVIGTDRDPSDGASISWTVHSGQRPMVVYIFAYNRPPSPDSGQIAVYVVD